MYSREAILANLLQQKKAIKRKTAEWEADQKAEADKVWGGLGVRLKRGVGPTGRRCSGSHGRAADGVRPLLAGMWCFGFSTEGWGPARPRTSSLSPAPRLLPQPQAAQKAAVEAEAALIAFDRSNHMGLRDETARGIQTAITAEAEALVEGRGAGAKSIVTLKDNEDRLKTLNVGGPGPARARALACARVGRGCAPACACALMLCFCALQDPLCALQDPQLTTLPTPT